MFIVLFRIFCLYLSLWTVVDCNAIYCLKVITKSKRAPFAPGY